MKTPPDFCFQTYFNVVCGGQGGTLWLPGRLVGLMEKKDGWTGAEAKLKGGGDSFPLADDLLSLLRELQAEPAFCFRKRRSGSPKAS